MAKEPKNVLVGMIYLDKDENGCPLVGDMHVLVKEVDRLMVKFKPKYERMCIKIYSELVERFEGGKS